MKKPGNLATSFGLLKGVWGGAGVGLLTCDFIDLLGGDPYPVFGWVLGICSCTTIGGVIGYFRDQRARRSGALPTRPLWPWFALAGGILYEAIGIGWVFRDNRSEVFQIWSTIMLIAGTAYLLVPTTVWLLRQLRGSRCPDRTSPTTKST